MFQNDVDTMTMHPTLPKSQNERWYDVILSQLAPRLFTATLILNLLQYYVKKSLPYLAKYNYKQKIHHLNVYRKSLFFANLQLTNPYNTA